MGAKHTRYSDEDRAAALACFDACGGNMSEAARRSGVPRKTLEDWVAGRVADGVAEKRQEKKQQLAEVFEALAYKLAGVADQKADGLNAKDAVIAAGVAVDKMRLLRGQATDIVQERLTVYLPQKTPYERLSADAETGGDTAPGGPRIVPDLDG